MKIKCNTIIIFACIFIRFLQLRFSNEWTVRNSAHRVIMTVQIPL